MKFCLATAENLLVFLEIIRLSHHGHDVINRSATFALIVRCHTASTTSIIIRHKSHFLELVPELKKLQHSLNSNLYRQIYTYSKFETPNNSKYCCYSHWHAQYSCKWLTLHVYNDNILLMFNSMTIEHQSLWTQVQSFLVLLNLVMNFLKNNKLCTNSHVLYIKQNWGTSSIDLRQ